MPVYIVYTTQSWIILTASIFLLAGLIQMVYFLFIYSTARKKKLPLNKRLKKFPPVSVIICAKNEAHNLKTKLPLFLNQDYPDFEVVVVDHASEDETPALLEKFRKDYKNLKVTRINKDPKFSHGKKLAVTIGIKAASHEILLFSDADCEPASQNWIKYMTRHYREKDKEIVLGIGLYKKKKGWINLLIRFETAFIAMQYTSLARKNHPYMGVGRNLSYKKALFFNNRGFASHLHLESGDDDLFISEVSRFDNTVVEIHPDSFTWSEPKENFKSWIAQKSRHLTTATSYKKSTRLLLGLEYLTRILTPVAFLILIVNSFFPVLIITSFSVYLLIKLIIYYLVFYQYGEKYLFLPSVFAGELIPYLYIYLHINNLISRKGRRWQ